MGGGKMATSDAQKKASIKYMRENLQELRFRVKTEQAEQIKAYAESKGLSLRAYLLALIEHDMAETKENQPENPQS